VSHAKITKGNFSVEILKHSVNPVGLEAITFQVTYEHLFHAQVMTHRWSRNFSSSRAIPHQKIREWIANDPAMPLHLGGNRSGMQAEKEVADPEGLRDEIASLYATTDSKCRQIEREFNPHKEIINRYLEPWGWMTGVITTGRAQLMNFFSLRCNADTYPNMQRLAVSMARLYRESVPQKLERNQWHTPYFDDYIPEGKKDTPEVHTALVWSTARAAWCSYNNPTKDATIWKALKRYEDCIKYAHATPLEHQLWACNGDLQCGVVPGYVSHRYLTPNESTSEFDFGILDRDYAGRDYIVKD